MNRVCCFYCERCKKETHFLPIHQTMRIAGVSRSTIYYWFEKNWVHFGLNCRAGEG